MIWTVELALVIDWSLRYWDLFGWENSEWGCGFPHWKKCRWRHQKLHSAWLRFPAVIETMTGDSNEGDGDIIPEDGMMIQQLSWAFIEAKNQRQQSVMLRTELRTSSASLNHQKTVVVAMLHSKDEHLGLWGRLLTGPHILDTLEKPTIHWGPIWSIWSSDI